jgi:hypothetical protein
MEASMRAFLLAALATVCLASSASTSAQTDPGPTRKPGWWEMQYVVVGASAFGTGTAEKPVHHTTHICTTPEIDRIRSPLDVNMTASACQEKVVRTATGWTLSGLCTPGPRTIRGDAVATGDLNDRYHVDIVYLTDPPLVQDGAEVRIGIDARWVGQCPADKKPGDTEGVPQGHPPPYN